MDFSRPIYWHEGMLLRPEHFQQQDRYHEFHLHQFFSQTNPYYWGVLSITINNDALADIHLDIEALTLITPDGALIRVPDNAVVERRSFEETLPPGGEPLSVYLGIMNYKPRTSNTTNPEENPPGKTDRRRFILKSGGSQTADLFAEERTSRLDFLHYDVRLFFGAEKETASDFRLIKIAEIVRTDKGFALSKRYISPVAAIGACPVLSGLIKAVRDKMTSKGRELRELKQEGGLRTHELGARDMLTLLYSLSVNRYIPMLHQITDPGIRIHPWQVYALFRSIIGELSSYSRDVSFLGAMEETGNASLPEYDHERLWNCFHPAVELIQQLLDNLVTQAAYRVKLTWDEEYYSADLDERIFTVDGRYYLIVSSQLPAKELLKILHDTAKICSREGMPTLITRALFGVPAEHLPSPPAKLPQKSHSYYFVLDHSSNIWKKIVQDKNIAVSFEGKQLEGVAIEFVMLSEGDA